MNDTASPGHASLLIGRALKSSAVFDEWDEASLEELVTASRLLHHERGRAVVKSERTWRELLVVVTGSVEISRTSSDGSRFVLNIVRAGDCVGLARLLPRPSEPYDHVAHEDALVVHVPVDSMLALLERRPLLWRSVALFALEKQREKIASLQHRALSVFPEQLARLLLTRAVRTTTVRAGAAPHNVHLSQAELAAMLGVSRQTVNKEMGKLAAMHIVQVSYGHIEIMDLPALRELAERSQTASAAGPLKPHR